MGKGIEYAPVVPVPSLHVGNIHRHISKEPLVIVTATDSKSQPDALTQFKANDEAGVSTALTISSSNSIDDISINIGQRRAGPRDSTNSALVIQGDPTTPLEDPIFGCDFRQLVRTRLGKEVWWWDYLMSKESSRDQAALV